MTEEAKKEETQEEVQEEQTQAGEEQEKQKKKEELKKKVIKELLSWLIYFAVVLTSTYLIITFVGQRTHVQGESMYSTLHDQDNLIVDKISYRFKDPERFDIIVFPYRYEEKTYYIKRVIGLPGETVQIIDGYIYINDELLEEDYGREVMEYSGRAEAQVTLGEDEYFVLGDNRNRSSDSRVDEVGNIHKDEIIGRAFVRIWPFNRFGVLKHQ